MPVASPDIPTQQVGQRGELDRFPDGDSTYHCERTDPGKDEIGSALKRVVLALNRVILADEEIELQHLDGVPEEPAHRHEISPLTVQIHIGEIREPVHDENPHHCEVPVSRAAEPAAESEVP